MHHCEQSGAGLAVVDINLDRPVPTDPLLLSRASRSATPNSSIVAGSRAIGIGIPVALPDDLPVDQQVIAPAEDIGQ